MFFLIIGLPIAFAFLLINFIGAYLFMGGVNGLSLSVQQIFTSLVSFSLAPIPLFIFMGELMFHSGMARRALDVVDLLIGKLPGRLSMVIITGGALFSTLSGSTIANTAMLGGMMVPEMKKQMWGRIINMSSMQAFMGSPTYSAYTASKAALSGLTRVWAAELAPFQVTVNAICPSFVETPMMAASIDRLAREKSISTEAAMAHFTAPIPQKRILQPEEIAFSALFLSSPLAQGVTGHDLVVAAGCVMH